MGLNFLKDFMNRFIRVPSLAVVSLLLAGCLGNGLPNLVEVTGTVMLDGIPLAHGTIGFVPVDPDGQAAGSQIVDGEFKIVTSASAPGAAAGKYDVIISSHQPQKLPDTTNFKLDPTKLPPPPKSLIPEKYSNPKTSGLEVTVAPGMIPLQFDIESAQ